MSAISLKKILSKKERLSVIDNLINAIGSPIGVTDANGHFLLGTDSENSSCKYAVDMSGETIGWVMGSEGASAVASLLSHLALQELEKKTLAREALDKYREIALLHDLAEKISASLELREVAKLAISEAQRLIEASSGSVTLFNKETGKIDIVAAFGNQDNTKATAIPVDIIVDSVLQTGRGQIVNDVSADPRFVDRSLPVKSLIYVPLKTKDRAIGAIALGSDEPVAYEAEDLKLLTMLASQAASAIENAILHENQLQESRREALLFRLASQIRLSLDLDTILETTVSEIRSLLQIDRCLFIWYRPKDFRWSSLELRIRSAEIETQEIGEEPEIAEFHEKAKPLKSKILPFKFPGWEVVKEACIPDKPSVLGYYAAKNLGSFTKKLLRMEMLRIDDVSSLRDRVLQQFLISQNFTSLLALPIQTRSGAIGAVSCGHCGELRPWSEQEIELLQAVGNQLAIALDQAELYEQTRNAAATATAQTQQLQQTLYELQQTQAQLIQSEKMSSLGALVAGVAHEINNPVSFITGNLDHAKDYTLGLMELLHLYQQQYPPTPDIVDAMESLDFEFLMSDLPKLLDSMKLGADRIREIVVSLRNFSRLDQSLKKPMDIHDGIESTLLILQNRLKPMGRRPGIQAIRDYGDLPLVECYAGQMNQVFMNLLSNAIDALEEAIDAPGGMAQAPTIRIRTEVLDRERVAIRIADNGPGMPEEVRRRLFQAFFTTKPVGKGTGLGLSISHSIVVDKHGGILKCVSEPGRGTEFCIQIPTIAIANSPAALESPRIADFAPSSQASRHQSQCYG